MDDYTYDARRRFEYPKEGKLHYYIYICAQLSISSSISSTTHTIQNTPHQVLYITSILQMQVESFAVRQAL
ncbi:hypothetical protein EON65_56480 [archaeon]|nr:MAG: hypothetical protein EON65_56480 [archaeon]